MSDRLERYKEEVVNYLINNAPAHEPIEIICSDGASFYFYESNSARQPKYKINVEASDDILHVYRQFIQRDDNGDVFFDVSTIVITARDDESYYKSSLWQIMKQMSNDNEHYLNKIRDSTILTGNKTNVKWDNPIVDSISLVRNGYSNIINSKETLLRRAVEECLFEHFLGLNLEDVPYHYSEINEFIFWNNIPYALLELPNTYTLNLSGLEHIYVCSTYCYNGFRIGKDNSLSYVDQIKQKTYDITNRGKNIIYWIHKAQDDGEHYED